MLFMHSFLPNGSLTGNTFPSVIDNGKNFVTMHLLFTFSSPLECHRATQTHFLLANQKHPPPQTPSRPFVPIDVESKLVKINDSIANGNSVSENWKKGCETNLYELKLFNSKMFHYEQAFEISFDP